MLLKKHLSRGAVATSSPEGPQNPRSGTGLLAAAVTADTKHFQPFDQQLFEVGMDVGCGKEN